MSARSLNAVATLGVRRGDEILLRASGPQADEALAAVRRLADDDWGDPREARRAGRRGRPPGPPAAGGRRRGSRPGRRPPAPCCKGCRRRRASPSAGARCLRAARVALPDGPSQDREADRAALERALAATGDDIRGLRESVAARAGGREAAIFDAHLLFLEDEALLGPAREGVTARGQERRTRLGRRGGGGGRRVGRARRPVSSSAGRGPAQRRRAGPASSARSCRGRWAERDEPRPGRPGDRRGARPEPRGGRRPRPRARSRRGLRLRRPHLARRDPGALARHPRGRRRRPRPARRRRGHAAGARRRGRDGHGGPAGRHGASRSRLAVPVEHETRRRLRRGRTTPP